MTIGYRSYRSRIDRSGYCAAGRRSKYVLRADLRQENADAAAKTLSEAGFGVTTTTVDVSSRASVEALVAKASSLGDVHGVIHAAGVSQAAPETILWKNSAR
jgi:NAD(P)-dependent dehydrogenase (short-subunit alcohol dehydrogenase family)